jgi:hypothetical protein
MNRTIAFLNTCTCVGYGSELGTSLRDRALPIEVQLTRLFDFARERGIVIVSTRCLQGGQAPPVGPAIPKALVVVAPNDTTRAWEAKLAGCSEVLLERKPVASLADVVYTRAYDLSDDNLSANELIRSLDIDHWVVFGVSMQGCVASAARGLMRLGKHVTVLSDAILPSGGAWTTLTPREVLEELRQEGAVIETTGGFLDRFGEEAASARAGQLDSSDSRAEDTTRPVTFGL